MREKEDLRVKRTKKMIRESFINLLYEKCYEKITIREIVENAMINRNTFYLHYQDKADLLEQIYKIYIEELTNSVNKLRLEEDLYHPDYSLETDAVFDHLEKNIYIYRAFLKGKCPNFDKSLKEFVFEAISREIKRQRLFDSNKLENLKAFTEYCTSGYMGMLILWLDEDSNTSISDIKKTVNQIIGVLIKIV